MGEKEGVVKPLRAGCMYYKGYVYKGWQATHSAEHVWLKGSVQTAAGRLCRYRGGGDPARTAECTGCICGWMKAQGR